MPIYEYKCDDCGQTFEAIQKISDKKLTNCRLCPKGKYTDWYHHLDLD